MVSSSASNIPTKESIFRSPFYNHQKKSQFSQLLINNLISKLGSFLNPSFSSNYLVPLIKCGRLLAFCIIMSSLGKVNRCLTPVQGSTMPCYTEVKLFGSILQKPRMRCCQAGDRISQVCGEQTQFSLLHIQ